MINYWLFNNFYNIKIMFYKKFYRMKGFVDTYIIILDVKHLRCG
jgi:hypothetical protein